MNGPGSQQNNFNCKKIRRVLPGYLDGALPEEGLRFSRAAIHEHISGCVGCREELSRYQKLQHLFAGTERVAPPEELGVEIRMALARARGTSSPTHWLRRFVDRADLIRQNLLAPLAVPVTGGLVAALLVFAMVLPSYARPPIQEMTGISDELPPALLQPARLESLAGFSVTGLGDSGSKAGVVMVEASIGKDGSILDYQILAGPDTPAVRRQLDQILFLSHFRPQTSFGRPIDGGRVVMSFSTVKVQG